MDGGRRRTMMMIMMVKKYKVTVRILSKKWIGRPDVDGTMLLK
jgi:hypothetical protein